MNRYARWVNLHKCRVRHIGAFFIGLPFYTSVAAHGIGGEEKYVSVAAGCYYNGVSAKAFYFAGSEVAGNNSAGFSVYHHYIEHIVAVVHFYLSFGNLPVECAISSEQ